MDFGLVERVGVSRNWRYEVDVETRKGLYFIGTYIKPIVVITVGFSKVETGCGARLMEANAGTRNGFRCESHPAPEFRLTMPATLVE